MSVTETGKNLITIAAPADGDQICAIAANAGVFSPEEVQCVAEIWQEYLSLGSATSGYTFFVEKAGERVLGFVGVRPRSLTDRVYDLYWIAVDPTARRLGWGAGCWQRRSSPFGRRAGASW